MTETGPAAGDTIELRRTDGEPPAASPVSPVGPTAAERLAAIERERMAAIGGRTGTAGLGARFAFALRRASGDEAALAALRYRPIAVTALAIVAIAFWFPGRPDGSDVAAQPATGPTPTVPAPTSSTTTATTISPGAPPTVPVTPGPAPAVPFTPPAGSPGPAPSSPSSPPPSPTVTSKLAVRGFGWASSLAGTPLGSAGVADDTMPVGNRLGGVDKASFVRLSGDTRVLELREHADSRQDAIGAPTVRACPIVSPVWDERAEQSFDDAPDWNGQNCVEGIESDGIWSFNLSAFALVTSDNGFALVPSENAPADFQVAFEPA